MAEKQRLEFAPVMTSLAQMRAVIEERCQAGDINPQIIYQIILAADEACANIIEHGYSGLPPAPIGLLLELSPDQMVVEISDRGHHFPPVEPPEPDPEALLASDKEGGLGIYLMYQSMDEISYRSQGGLNTLRMVKHLP